MVSQSSYLLDTTSHSASRCTHKWRDNALPPCFGRIDCTLAYPSLYKVTDLAACRDILGLIGMPPHPPPCHPSSPCLSIRIVNRALFCNVLASCPP